MWGKANSSNQRVSIYTENPLKSYLWIPALYNLVWLLYFRYPIAMNDIWYYYHCYFNQEKQNLMVGWDPQELPTLAKLCLGQSLWEFHCWLLWESG